MTKVNIREALNQMDKDTNCKYDLVTLYEGYNFNDEEKKEIAKMISDNEDAEVIYDRLSDKFGKDVDFDDDDISDITLDECDTMIGSEDYVDFETINEEESNELVDDLVKKAFTKEQAEYLVSHDKGMAEYLAYGNADNDDFEFYIKYINKRLDEDTVKTSKGKWVNKGEEGTHGTFNTKKEADAQRKAMFASGYKGESLSESINLGDKVNYHNKQYVVIDNSNDDLLVLRPFDRFTETDFDDIESGDNSEDIYIAPYQLLNNESLDEKLNLDKEGKALKRAIKNIVVDNDDELREFVSAIVEEVISENNPNESLYRESKNEDIRNILFTEYQSKYTPDTHDTIYNEIKDKYNDETLASQVVSSLENDYKSWFDESLNEEFKTYYISYKDSEGKFKDKYVDLPIRATSKEEAEEKFMKDHPNIKSYDYKVISPESLKESDKETLTESSYGGAYDILDDEYFTKDDGIEAVSEILSIIRQNFADKEFPDIQLGLSDMELNNRIFHVTLTDEDENEFTEEVQIDMRKIRHPLDLIKKYVPLLAERLIKQIKDYYSEM